MALAPPGTYLIVGRPRSRTAWLSSILFNDELPCFHDEYHRLMLFFIEGQGRPFGFAAPSLPVMPVEYWDLFVDCPIVVIDRPSSECFASLERFVEGFEASPAAQQMYESRFKALIERLPAGNMLHVAYGGLDDFGVVDRISRHCTGRPLNPDRFHAFDLLRVEQHLPKVIKNTPASVYGVQQWHG
jgi:hypothetical protein